MTFSPKVWGDALRRLQHDTPDFAFDAWIVPLQVKVARDHGTERMLLGCPHSFHRDRVRLHHLEAIERAVAAAVEAHADQEEDGPRATLAIELVTAREFAEAEGRRIEGKVGMRRVSSARSAQVVNGPGTATVSTRASQSQSRPTRSEESEPPTGGATRPALHAVPDAENDER